MSSYHLFIRKLIIKYRLLLFLNLNFLLQINLFMRFDKILLIFSHYLKDPRLMLLSKQFIIIYRDLLSSIFLLLKYKAFLSFPKFSLLLIFIIKLSLLLKTLFDCRSSFLVKRSDDSNGFLWNYDFRGYFLNLLIVVKR